MGMQDGGSYTLAVTDTSATTHTFTHAGTGLTFKFQPANGNTTAGSTTIYAFLRIGTIAYVSWISGF